ncbi:MAG TPA: alpha-amylase family glycosyl hydrolase [Flavitalea sp.]|nr:alpha-amylase family glycosyl hydrolase [Flavitalea sp.]
MSIAFPTINWANGTNIYEVNIRQYTREGTFNAFKEHIPRLHHMGIDILWLMPVTPISVEKRQGTFGSYYAASSYIDIDPIYGTADDFRDIITTAHYYGMKVIIDWVANHTGYDHVWTKKHPNFYRKDAKGNFTELYGWLDVIDLNYEIPEMRLEMISSMKHWVKEFEIDGFRCDMARTVPVDFWIEARSECDSIKPLFWLAECEILNYHEVFDVTYGWECMRACDKFFKGEVPFTDIIDVLIKYSHYPAGSRKLLFTSNHDENTYWGTEFEKYGVAAKAMAIFSCTFPGIPLIYSGQEKPNTKRLAFFEKDFIDWEGNIEMQDFYSTLLTLRKRNQSLQENASVLLITPDQPEILVYLCRRHHERVLVMLSFSGKDVSFTINHPAIAGVYHNLFGGDVIELSRKETFDFPPGDCAVYHISGLNSPPAKEG